MALSVSSSIMNYYLLQSDSRALIVVVGVKVRCIKNGLDHNKVSEIGVCAISVVFEVKGIFQPRVRHVELESVANIRYLLSCGAQYPLPRILINSIEKYN
jgi:hypothetical protein